MLQRNVEAVDYGKRFVLFPTCPDEFADSLGAPCIVGHEILYIAAVRQGFAYMLRPYVCHTPLVWFGIVVNNAVDDTLTVAHHPYLVSMAAINHGACRHTMSGIGLQSFEVNVMRDIDIAHGRSDTGTEIPRRYVARHLADEITDGEHAQPSVAHGVIDTCGTLARAAVDDGDEIIVYHRRVFACLAAYLSYDCLFYYYHNSLFSVCACHEPRPRRVV